MNGKKFPIHSAVRTRRALAFHWTSSSRGYLTLTYGQSDSTKNSSSCGDTYPLCHYRLFAEGKGQQGVTHTVCIDIS